MDVQPPPRSRPPVQLVAPPARTRPAPAAPRASTPDSLPVIGGPPRPEGLSAEFVWPVGYYVALPGTCSRVHPYVKDDHRIGMVCNEYHQPKKGSTDRAYLKAHLYRLDGGTWRYVGAVDDPAEGRRKLEMLYSRARSLAVPTQVSPPARVRRAA